MPIKSEVTAQEIISYLKDKHAPSNEVDTIALRAAGNKFKISYPTVLKRLKKYKKGRGTWDLTALDIEKAYQAPAAEPAVKVSYVPEKDPNYVPFGNANSLKKVINSRQFYPVFITGLSGNGKTLGVEQACANLNRELIRVNITIETDEDDLIGGFRLVNGDTVWHNGPVVEALDRGAVLLLDEIDLASNKILCLQSILEGKGIFLKKTGRYVKPAAGFTAVSYTHLRAHET